MSVTQITDDNIDTGIDTSKCIGAIGAMDGSALTGINAGTSLLKNATDPALDTNPVDGVGAIWINTSTGQMFSCTDATTDQNTWTNMGIGTGHVTSGPLGYQGTTSGYSCGSWASLTGGDVIDKYSYNSDGDATDVGNLLYSRGTSGGSSSTTYGHIAGGGSDADTSLVYSTIDRVSFANGGDAVGWGDLTSGTKYSSSYTDWDVAGYSIGGSSAAGAKTDIIQKYPFASNSGAVDTGANLTHAYTGMAGMTDRVGSYGYAAGYSDPNNAGGSDIIQRYAFNSSVNSASVGTLTTAYRLYTNGVNSDTHGYTLGGYGPGRLVVPNAIINKFAFASSTTAVDWANLTYLSGGNNSTTSAADYGYSAANYNVSVSWISKFPYASQTNTVSIGSLTVARAYNVGNQV